MSTNPRLITLTVACTRRVPNGTTLFEALRQPTGTGKPDEMVWHLLERYLLLVRLGRNSKGLRKRARLTEFGIADDAEIHPDLRLALDTPMGYTPYEAVVMSRTKAIADAERAANEHHAFLNAFRAHASAMESSTQHPEIVAEARALAALLDP